MISEKVNTTTSTSTRYQTSYYSTREYSREIVARRLEIRKNLSFFCWSSISLFCGLIDYRVCCVVHIVLIIDQFVFVCSWCLLSPQILNLIRSMTLIVVVILCDKDWIHHHLRLRCLLAFLITMLDCTNDLSDTILSCLSLLCRHSNKRYPNGRILYLDIFAYACEIFQCRGKWAVKTI